MARRNLQLKEKELATAVTVLFLLGVLLGFLCLKLIGVIAGGEKIQVDEAYLKWASVHSMDKTKKYVFIFSAGANLAEPPIYGIFIAAAGIPYGISAFVPAPAIPFKRSVGGICLLFPSISGCGATLGFLLYAGVA